MSDDPNSAKTTEREAYVPISINELARLLDTYTHRSTVRHALLELVDQRRDRVTLQKENAELRGQLDLLTRVNAEVSDIRQTREDRSDVWAAAKAWLGKPTDTEAFAERLAAVEDRLTATATVSHVVTANKSIGALSNRIAYVEGALQHHASLIAGLGRQAVAQAAEDTALRDGPNGPEFPDPVPAEELVLERGSIVRVRKNAQSGMYTLSENRDWEVVGLRSAADEQPTVQLALLPWVGDAGARPLYWVSIDDIVGLA